MPTGEVLRSTGSRQRAKPTDGIIGELLRPQLLVDQVPHNTRNATLSLCLAYQELILLGLKIKLQTS
ncbi:MAG: hypothetical protein ACYC1U_04615 [Candidatus Aquicultorales bacterium]